MAAFAVAAKAVPTRGIALLVGCVVLMAGCGSGAVTPKPTGSTPVGPPPSVPSVPPAPVLEQFGASVNRLFNDRRYSSTEIEDQLRALRATGATIARSDALWEATETRPPIGGRHRYDWRFDDVVAGALAQNRLRWLPVLDYSAAWDQSISGEEHSAPRDPSDFAAFAGAFAARYGATGTFWQMHPSLPKLPVEAYEVWNEPDNAQFWGPAPDPARYAGLYLLTRDAIRAVDSTARVLIGGLTKPGRFVPAVVAAQPSLASAIDGVAIHPYGRNPGQVLGRVRSARLALRSAGLGAVPLYVTEFGWVTSPAGARNWVPAALRPRYLQSTVAALGHTNCGIGAVIVYTWITPYRNQLDPEDWFGIDPLDGRASADTDGFASGLRLAAQPAPERMVC